MALQTLHPLNPLTTAQYEALRFSVLRQLEGYSPAPYSRRWRCPHFAAEFIEAHTSRVSGSRTSRAAERANSDFAWFDACLHDD